jgi:hypothetical protein
VYTALLKTSFLNPNVGGTIKKLFGPARSQISLPRRPIERGRLSIVGEVRQAGIERGGGSLEVKYVP